MHRPPTPPSPRSLFADLNNKTPREIGKSSIIRFLFIYVLSEEEEFTRLPYDTIHSARTKVGSVLRRGD